MQLRIFTLRFNPVTERFDDSAVVGFLADKDVISIKDHFFLKDNIPFITLVVNYRPVPLPATAAADRPAEAQRDQSWKELLTEEDWPLFKTLRAWRGERAKQDGIPPYVICNNRQLAEIIKARPRTMAELGQLDGIGEAKLKNYGNDILALIAGDTVTSQEQSDGKHRQDRQP